MAKPKGKAKATTAAAVRSAAEVEQMLLLERLGGPVLPARRTAPPAASESGHPAALRARGRVRGV